jgi:hypothetical protein
MAAIVDLARQNNAPSLHRSDHENRCRKQVELCLSRAVEYPSPFFEQRTQ